MAAEIIQIDTQNFTTQLYNSLDVNLISSFDVDTSLSSQDNIELFIYNPNNTILTSEYNFNQYSIYNNGQSAGSNGNLSQISIDVEKVLLDRGYSIGEYILYFNFLTKRIGSFLEPLYIAEISSDRTEIRLDSTVLDILSLLDQTNNFITERNNSSYFLDFYLNFGENNLFIANNIALDTQDPTNPTVLVKLYEPLPQEYSLNSVVWVSSAIDEPLAYRVNFPNEPIIINDTLRISGPNFNINIKDQINNSTLELAYSDLISTSLTSSQNQLNSLLEEKELDINIDYTNFEDFIHFSSAKTRLENFYYKVSLIEQYSSSISLLNSTLSSPTSVSGSQAIYQSKINDIITNFDGWDYYLYYSTGSWSWPKTTSTLPYQLASTGSAAVLNWFGSTNEYSPSYGGIILSASLYDENNKDNLLFSIPEYLREDPSNEPYELFIDMVAQHFDNIWIYYKDVTQKYNADNRLEYGISKDIVADAIKDFGVKLYQNNFSNQDLYTAFIGLTPQGGLFPFPEITGSLPTPTGFEYVDTLISASNDYIPLDDVNKSLYKRLYHNLPYLLKSKGTLPGLKALITSYGIPDTILRISEFGGKDKVDSNDWDYWQNEYNFAFATAGDNFISSSWDLNPSWNSPNNVPSTLMFRFKTNGLPHTNIPYSQSLWYGDGGTALTLTYTGSAYASGSYSGSIIDPHYQFATLTFYPDLTEPSTSSAVYLPFFDGDWWSVMVTRSGSNFTLYSQNKLYEGGNNGTILGFNQSSSIIGDSTPWINSSTSYFPVSFSVGAPFGYDVVTYDNTAIYDGTGSLIGSFTPISGAYQEIRYYSSIISEDVFKDYTMNPYSIEGNSLNSSPNELAFRANIGGELYTGSYSTHPKVTGSWITTHSFASDSSFYYDSTPNFITNREYFFFDQPIAGIKNAVSDKIRLEDNTIPTGSTLSFYRRIAQNTEASASYTPNTNLLEVAFSPQNEINDDINSSLGYFNIGNFIGDPSQRFSNNSYSDLDKLREEYFQKYTKNYNLTDFVRLIKFFDNSLFKMIKDFVPARTSLASGIVIKQHLLERNKYPQPQMSYSDLDISGTLKPQWNDYNDGTVENFGGGTGGSFEQFNNISNTSQSWIEHIPTPLGTTTVLHNSQDEFYNGEFNGSEIVVTTQSLNQQYTIDTYPPSGTLTFYNSDYNATINNVIQNRKNTLLQDVDYTQGSLIPVNFGLLISGSAVKAEIPDSNYTMLRHITPRYLGSKSTSQHINAWTPGDEGTYGQTPTAENLKTALAYCDWIGGWPPERMNASAAHVKYFIHADGTVSIPNTTDTSLYTNQNAFVSGERLIITTGDNGSQVTPYRNIIRGGTRIEPILYTQSGSSPAYWTSSISLTTDFITNAAIGDYTARAKPSINQIFFSNGTYNAGNMNQVISTGSVNTWQTNGYVIIQDVIDEGVSLDFYVVIKDIYLTTSAYGDQNHNFSMQLIQERGVSKTVLASDSLSYYQTGPVTSNKKVPGSLSLYYTISPQDILANDKFYIQTKHDAGTMVVNDTYFTENSTFTVTQIPSPTNTQIISTGTNTIWGYPDNTKTNIITGSNAVLNGLYDQGFTQVAIPNSGFNPVVLPFNIKVGDEFRFEGSELSAFMVKRIYSPAETDSNRLSNVGTIEVQFNQNLPSSSINLDHFVIRRYVDDAAQILMEGFKPLNSTGPYIVRPEYVVPELDKSIDEFVLILTQKGLL